ncbi:MAG: hypothetical protein WJU30_00340 [Candidatus Phytoplasma pruni]
MMLIYYLVGKKRVVITRALCIKPQILLLDEPTSALDSESAHEVLTILKKISDNKKITLIIITHEMNFAKKVSNTIFFRKRCYSGKRNSKRNF